MGLDEPTVLFSEEAIRERVAELARRISKDYSRAGDLRLVGVLRGSFIFLADLSRQLTVPSAIDFIAVSSYGQGTRPEDGVRLVMDLRTDISGKHVLIVEDIVDTGRTMEYLVSLLASRGPASLRTCAMLRKPARLEKAVRVDYVGFDVPDAWVVGYGLDYRGRQRALPYIGIVSETDSAGRGDSPSRPKVVDGPVPDGHGGR